MGAQLTHGEFPVHSSHCEEPRLPVPPFKEFMKDKMFYTICGCLLSLVNIALIETRFTIVGMGFGIVGAILIIKAILIKENK